MQPLPTTQTSIASPSAEYDVTVSGGTLGIFVATALARRSVEWDVRAIHWGFLVCDLSLVWVLNRCSRMGCSRHQHLHVGLLIMWINTSAFACGSSN